MFVIAEFGAFGGTRSYFWRLLDYYLTRGYRVTVGLAEEQLDDEVVQRFGALAVDLVLLPFRPKGRRWLWHRAPFSFAFDIGTTFAKLIRFRPNLVVVSIGSPGLFMGLALLPFRFLYILHTYPHEEIRWYGKGAYRFACRMFGGRKKLLTVSEFAKRQIIQKWECAQKVSEVRVIYNTVGDGSEPRRRERNRASVRVLTLGHVVDYKNPKVWLEVAKTVTYRAKLAGMHVEFVWAGDGCLLDDCRSQVVGTPYASQISFVGFCREVERLYQKADIYLQPSLIDNNPLSIADAMRHGIPCIGTRVGGIPELIEDGVTGFLSEPEDIEGMSEQVLELVLNENERTRLADNGRDRYQRLFSGRRWEAQMDSLHTELMKT